MILHTCSPVGMPWRMLLASAFILCTAFPADAGEPRPASALATRPAGIEHREGGFAVNFDRGALTSLKRVGDRHDTDYIHLGARFGDLVVRWRRGGGGWQTAATRQLTEAGKSIADGSSPGVAHSSRWRVAEGNVGGPQIQTQFVFEKDSLIWTITLSNPGQDPVEIGDLAFQCPMNTKYVWDREITYHQRVIRHSLISGNGSFMFWMRCSAEGPFLLLTPLPNTALEYFDLASPLSGPGDTYTAYIHSAGQLDVLKQHGTNWRQANTSLILSPAGQDRSSVSYGFRLSWANDYEDVRRQLVEGQLFDVRVAPGMTVPADLSARIAVRTRTKRLELEPEFPAETEIRDLGEREDSTRLYEVSFRRLGENLVRLRADGGRGMVLEFFVTESLETLIRKRARFLARCQHRDPTKWYNGLITDWNMRDRVLPSPDNLDRIPESRRYAVTCDDPGLCKAPFMAAKNVEYPERSEVEALEYYVEHFLWGGLQMTDRESHPFGLYGIQDWKRNRESADPGEKGRLHLWRIYDYPHVVMLYLHLYRIARDYPELHTRISAGEYLRRAHGTAMALFRYPLELVKWSPYETGLYNELVIVEVIQELQRAGLPAKAAELRQHWDRKVEFFVSGRANLFASEYPFDTTGFEATHAMARYVLRQEGDLPVTRDDAMRFMHQQAAINVGARGWLEAAYYLLGSDYRGSGNGRYTLSYMSQMGGWALLDYSLYHADDPHRLLPLAYASILSSWALMNTGTEQSNYGYWYPGIENDGGAGGGFEPAPYGQTWLGQPHHRGSWYYGCEIDLGFGGALRGAATIFAEDPVFGPIAYGGRCERRDNMWRVWCRDGVRRRFHVLRKEQRVHLELDRDHFAGDTPVQFDDAISTLSFDIETPAANPHVTMLQAAGLPPGAWTVALDGRPVQKLRARGGTDEPVRLQLTRSRHRVILTAQPGDPG